MAVFLDQYEMIPRRDWNEGKARWSCSVKSFPYKSTAIIRWWLDDNLDRGCDPIRTGAAIIDIDDHGIEREQGQANWIGAQRESILSDLRRCDYVELRLQAASTSK